MKQFYSGFIAWSLCYFSVIMPGHAQTHLLLSEIGLAPSGGEFIEIYNLTNAAISLDNYYLADNANYATYHSLATPPVSGDFIVRFPSGAIIQSNQVMVIALSSVDFSTSFVAVTPDFELSTQNIAIPDMMPVAVTGTPTLTNAGEGIILFYWDGVSDLVQDVDMMNAGVPAGGNSIVSKTGLAIDGPDADAVTSTYLTDAASIPLQSSTPGPGFSTKRILPETGYETASGGNGISGNDETSENTASTWDAVFTSPDPGNSILEMVTATLENTLDNYSVFPNPFTDQLTFRLSENDNATVSVYDFLSRRIVRSSFENSETINTGKLPAGIYFYELKSASGSIKTGRLIKD